MKSFLSLVVISLLLGACTARSGYDGAPASSRSGVEVYGTIDAGIGSQNQSR
jgi:hypothetical protein